MSKIKILNTLVSERIAAGEVIERPASVVKELVENALDAQASEITIHLEEGGKSLIEVLDNGTGMPREDLKLCVQRHATSKLSGLEDLEKIRTLGFRGEALPSIAAVSHLSIISRSTLDENAFELTGNPENFTSLPELKPITFGHFLGSPHGTRIRAQGLFSQIPARLKFLKSQASEVFHVREWISRLALTHPETGFRLTSDDRTVLNFRPQSEIDRVKTILSEGEDFPVITLQNEVDSSLSLRLHWIQGLSLPQTRKLVQIVNRRAVKDRVLQQAMLSSFKQALLPGQFPALALFLEIDPSLVDVNVHPTKTEIRFLSSSKVFHAIESLASEMISKKGVPSIVAPTYGTSYTAAEPTHVQHQWHLTPAYTSQIPNESQDKSQENAPPKTHPFSEGKYMGILFNTYLLYQFGNELGMIDQHAAHERIRYEKLKKSFLENSPRSCQSLLIPEAIRIDSDSLPVLKPRLSWLEKLGFEVEFFGEESLLFRAIPHAWGTDSIKTRLKNLVEKLLEAPEQKSKENMQKENMIDESLFESLASEACHSAIRAGDPLHPIEAFTLVEDLFRCQHPWNCPHGRPTTVRIPEGKLEEWFHRKV